MNASRAPSSLEDLYIKRNRFEHLGTEYPKIIGMQMVDWGLGHRRVPSIVVRHEHGYTEYLGIILVRSDAKIPIRMQKHVVNVLTKDDVKHAKWKDKQKQAKPMKLVAATKVVQPKKLAKAKKRTASR
ncbi:MAG: hypothetical protein WC477_05880 [Patescibacteria group bacterium]